MARLGETAVPALCSVDVFGVGGEEGAGISSDASAWAMGSSVVNGLDTSSVVLFFVVIELPRNILDYESTNVLLSL